MNDSAQTLSALRGRLAEGMAGGCASGHGFFVSGHGALDACLKGGFQRGQLHEVFAGDAEDNGSASGFAAMLGLCAMQPGKSMLWLRTLAAVRRGGRFNPAGFAELGGDPSTLLMAIAQDETALLRCAADALRCDGFGVVVIECRGSPAILDLTASRRLTLAADHSGVTAVMLRLDAREQPSTASTRWLVRSAPASPLEAGAPGYPTLDLTLLRQRAGPAGREWKVEWDRDAKSFRLPSQVRHGIERSRRTAPLPGAVVPVPAIGQAMARARARLIA